MPALVQLWAVAGSENAPATNVTLRDMTIKNWGEAPGARTRYPASYAGALHVGPWAQNVLLYNLSIFQGSTNAVGVCSSVKNAVIDRITVYDIGGSAVHGVCQNLANTTVGTVVSNSTISNTGFYYLSGAALEAVGTHCAVVHNEIFNVPLDGISVQMIGGPSRATAPVVEVAFNSIHDFGAGAILSDYGGVYLSTNSDSKPSTNWLAAEVHHNLILRGFAYYYGANGLYNDHGTSGPLFRSNIVADLGGRGLSIHCGNNISALNNIFYNVSTQPFACSKLPCDQNCAVSGCNGYFRSYLFK